MDKEITLAVGGTEQMRHMRLVLNAKTGQYGHGCLDVVARFDRPSPDLMLAWQKIRHLLELEVEGSWVVKEGLLDGEEIPHSYYHQVGDCHCETGGAESTFEEQFENNQFAQDEDWLSHGEEIHG